MSGRADTAVGTEETSHRGEERGGGGGMAGRRGVCSHYLGGY